MGNWQREGERVSSREMRRRRRRGTRERERIGEKTESLWMERMESLESGPIFKFWFPGDR